MAVDTRRLTEDDLPFAAEQVAREGWATGRGHLEALLAHDPDGGFVATEESTPVGMVTTTRYRASGWIGNLIVDPEHRSRGIGRGLMIRALEGLRGAGIETIRLDGDPPGIPLYRSLGFVDEYESCRYQGRGRLLEMPEAVDRLTADHLEELSSLDTVSFGDDRGRLLGLLQRQTSEAFLIRRKGLVLGYLMVRPADRGCLLGPCVAKDPQTAGLLLAAAMSTARSEPLVVGIPAPNRQGKALLHSLGFEPLPSSSRMILGPTHARGRPEQVFAIASGAVG